MKFILVNGRTPRPPCFCALCCEPIGESYLREIATLLPSQVLRRPLQSFRPDASESCEGLVTTTAHRRPSGWLCPGRQSGQVRQRSSEHGQMQKSSAGGFHAMQQLFRLDACGLDDWPPFLDLRLVESAERIRRLPLARENLLPELRISLTCRRVG
jgi:hypothetical protein